MAFEPKQPNFANGSCIAVWRAVDKNGKEYLKVKVFGEVINCFQPNEKKEE